MLFILLIVLLLLFGGGGVYGYRSGWYGPASAGPGLGNLLPLILILLFVMLLLGFFGHRGGYLSF